MYENKKHSSYAAILQTFHALECTHKQILWCQLGHHHLVVHIVIYVDAVNKWQYLGHDCLLTIVIITSYTPTGEHVTQQQMAETIILMSMQFANNL